MAFEQYQIIAREFFRREQFMSWAWLVLAWNTLCRHDNLKSLGFHMLHVSQDTIRTEFDRTKTNSSAQQSLSESNPKHVFANPTCPEICPYLALGIWLASSPRDGANVDVELVFPSGDSAHQAFQRQLKALLADPDVQVQLMAVGWSTSLNILSHSTRKGAATFIAGSDCTGGWLVAICRRGDWSINQVLDAYIKCTVGGDQTIGRVASGLDPNGFDFGALPPHFLPGNQEIVRKVLAALWGSGPTAMWRFEGGRMEPLLQRLAASLVFDPWVDTTTNLHEPNPGTVFHEHGTLRKSVAQFIMYSVHSHPPGSTVTGLLSAWTGFGAKMPHGEVGMPVTPTRDLT